MKTIKQMDAEVAAQQEARRLGAVKELDVRTQVVLASYGCKTVEEYARARCVAHYVDRNVQVRLKDGRTMTMGIDNAVDAILRGAGTLVEPS